MVQKSKTTKTSKASPKTKSKSRSSSTPTDTHTSIDYKDICNSVIELNEAFIKEVDNLMKSNITAAQIGKILGDIVSSFDRQTADVKKQL